MTTAEVEVIQNQTVTVDGWVAYDYVDPPVDSDGNIWIWQEIEGWFGGLDVRAAPVPRPLADGEHDGPAPFGGRTVTVSGSLVATSRAGLQRGMDRLAGVLASGTRRRGPLIIDEAQRGLARQALVRLAGPTMITRTSTYQAEWSISLYAADPIRHGLTEHSLHLIPFSSGGGRVYNLVPNRHYGTSDQSGTGDAHNAGNTNAPMVISLIGPCLNPSVRLVGGDAVRYMGTVIAGEVVVIDTGRRTVLLNGANRRQNLSADSRWITLPPGDSRLLFWTDDAGAKTGEAFITWQDAWL